MKIKYEFLTGESVEIEIEQALGAVVVEIERDSYNSDRTETRRHESYSNDNDKQETLVDMATNVEAAVISNIEADSLYSALDKLLPQQRELIEKVYFECISIAQIARDEGVSESAIRDRLNRIYKKLKNILS